MHINNSWLLYYLPRNEDRKEVVKKPVDRNVSINDEGFITSYIIIMLTIFLVGVLVIIRGRR